MLLVSFHGARKQGPCLEQQKVMFPSLSGLLPLFSKKGGGETYSEELAKTSGLIGPSENQGAKVSSPRLHLEVRDQRRQAGNDSVWSIAPTWERCPGGALSAVRAQCNYLGVWR